MIRKLTLALAILALTGTPALARGGGFHGGDGFRGGYGRFERFDRFHHFGGFFVPYSYYPYPYYTYANPYPVYSPPAAVEQPPVAYQQPPVQREVVYPNGKYVLYGDGVNQAYQWVWIQAGMVRPWDAEACAPGHRQPPHPTSMGALRAPGCQRAA